MKSFTARITCRFAALVTGTTAVVLALGGYLLETEVERGLELLHDVEVRELTELIGTDAKLTAAGVADRIKHDADNDAAMFALQVADASGTVLFRSDNLGTNVLPAGNGPDEHWTTELPVLGRVHLSYYLAGPWRIHIGSLLEPSERLLRNYVRISIPLLIGVGLVSIGLGYTFSRATLRPLRAIEATANRIRADNLAERIPVPEGTDELASLSRLLNQTFDRLEASFEQIRRFSADVSHELKTPLALIRLNVEKLRSRFSGDAEATLAVGDVLEEIARLNQVIDRLLFLAKAESGALPLVLQSTEVSGLIATFAEDAQALAEDRNVRFEVLKSDVGTLNVEPNLLRQLLLNLVANAVAVSPSGCWVRLESFAAEGAWKLIITDEGPGIPAAELARIFERFVQVHASGRAAEPTRGHGLGLAICKSIATLHHGTIAAENRGDRSGVRVTVTLPRR